MKVGWIAVLAAMAIVPAMAQNDVPGNAGVGNSNTTNSATADAPLANPNDEHANKVGTQSGADIAQRRMNRAAAKTNKAPDQANDTPPAASPSNAH